MANQRRSRFRVGVLNDLASVSSRAAAVTLRPLTGAVGAATDAGIGLERRALDRLLDSGEVERLLDSTRLHALAAQALDSDGVRRLIDNLFDSGLIDYFIERLLASDAVWHLIDVVADSPAVTAAISQQGLGFADQLGEELRARSRKSDDWLERAAARLIHRRAQELSGAPEATTQPASR
jgi:hypothetical protein